MQLKKITTFTLLAIVLIICSLSTISAATHSITNSTSDGGIRTALNGASPGDIIELADGTYTGNNNTNMTINKNITIQGKTKDKVILDAQGLSRIFTIANNMNVTFINLTFLNGYTNNNGGAIYNIYANSTIKLMNCTFINNSVTTFAGAIYNIGDNMGIYDCKIINSSTFNSRAGAIYNSGNNMIISGCEFTNISANNFSGTTSSYGGAIYNNGTNMAIYDCNFTNTIAYNHGGAIYTNGDNTVILGCNFINNTLYSGTGVGIFNNGINTTISNCNFLNNSGNSFGGAIRNAGQGNNLVVSYCNFTNNIGSNGGAFFSNMAINISVLYCNFINNIATINGGAIAISSGDDIVISNCNFINNSAIEYGGAIFNNGNMSVSNNTMADNSAGLGQMIYNNGSMGILNLTYINNSTIAVLNGSTITIYATLTDDMGNTVTGQDILFYVDGIFIANLTSIEGQANTTYLVNKTPVAILPVTGEYSGHEGYSININNGQLEIIKRNIIVNITIEENLDGSITVIANATYEDDGTPVIDHPVDFILNDEIVGTGITDENGIAKITIPANKIKNGTNNITVIVKGDENSNDGTASTIYIRTSNPDPVDPIDPIDPVNPVDPNNPNEPSKNDKTSNNPAVKTSAAMKETGIPINLILLVLLSCLGIVIRKTRK